MRWQFRKKWSFLLVFVVFSSATIGCSFRRIAYRYADWIVMNRLDAAFDLTSDQDEMLEQIVDRELVWVNNSFIPEIANRLEDSHTTSKDGLSLQEAQAISKGYRTMRARLMTRIAPHAGVLFVSLSKDQIKHFKAFLADANEKIEDRLKLSDEELTAAIIDDQVEMLEDWFGSLSDAQVAHIYSIHQPSRTRVESHLKIRRAFQAAVVRLAENPQSVQHVAATINAWGSDPSQMLPEDLRPWYWERSQRRALRMAAFDKIITEKQRQHFLRKMNRLIVDLRSMTADQT